MYLRKLITQEDKGEGGEMGHLSKKEGCEKLTVNANQ